MRVERGAEPIPGYFLVERLGGGGFGEVWKAQAPGGLLKAIKIVYGDSLAAGEDGRRAAQEHRALDRVKSVRHPYLLSLERYEIVDGRLVIVMELADCSLWERFKECRAQGLPGIPRGELLGFVQEAAEALDLMNIEFQLQHLDVKPQNLFLVHNHVKVADFGLVKDLAGRETRVTGGVTPVYAPPETFEGRISTHSDQYSLAIVYQELLTGKRPFQAGNVHQLILKHLNESPDLSPLPIGDREVLARALAKDPRDRFPSCLDMVRALRKADPAPATHEAPGPNGAEASHQLSNEVAPASSLLEIEGEPPTALMHRPARTTASPSQPAAAAPEAQPLTVAEIQGDGELFPALVVGLGKLGFLALSHLRSELTQRVGGPEAIPNVRLLYIDTDQDAWMEAATAGTGHLNTSEVLWTPLRRARHFLRPREGRPKLENWLDPRLLYRIQRTQETGGLRVLGRLAFVDNHRSIRDRLQAELEQITDERALETAIKKTGRAMRSNVPRVYVVAGLGGGSGSGMFIDLAYTARDCLKRLGYAHREVMGLFVLAAADKRPNSIIPLGNTFAAVTELHHFSSPGAVFSATYDEREATIYEASRPFDRCFLISAASEEKKESDIPSLAGAWLAMDLATPLGRHADDCRSGSEVTASQGDASSYSAFGLYRMEWPRQVVLRQGARRYCRRLIERWLSKDATAILDSVQDLVREQWQAHELVPEGLIERFQTACQAHLGKSPEAAADEILTPLLLKERKAADLPAASIPTIIHKLDLLLGQPVESAVLAQRCLLDDLLDNEAASVVADWKSRVERFTVELFENPDFRLAGAEEATRQVVALFERVARHYEPLYQELAERGVNVYDRIRNLIIKIAEQGKALKRSSAVATEFVELVKPYPKLRFHCLVLKRVGFAFTSLRGYFSDQLRELNFHRLRLTDLRRLFDDTMESASEGPGHGRYVFPPGCRTLAEALDQLFPADDDEELKELDAQLQIPIHEHFGSLAHVCVSSSNMLKELEKLMVEQISEVAAGMLPQSRVVDVYMERYRRPEEAIIGLTTAYAEAAPRLACPVARDQEFAILGVPTTAANDAFCRLAHQALPQIKQVETAWNEGVVLYRERTNFSLAQLEQLGPAAESAYRQMAAAESFPPHCRHDIVEWRPLTAPG
jgi:serine/threonine protein kinase